MRYVDIKGEGNILKNEIEKVVEKINIGKNEENNSVNIVFNQEIYVNNLTLPHRENPPDQEIRSIMRDVASDMLCNPNKYGLSNAILKNLNPDELESKIARAVVDGTGIAASDHATIKSTESVPKNNASVDNEDELHKYLTMIKNKLWRKIPKRLKLVVAILYAVIVLVSSTLIVIGVQKSIEFIGLLKTHTQDPIVPQSHISGLQNGGFENGFAHWEDVSKPRYATEDATIIYQGNIAISSRISMAGKKSLYIFNDNPKSSGRQIIRVQHIEGLMPNQKYNISFYAKGDVSSRDSFWLHLGDDWNTNPTQDRLYINADDDLSNWKQQAGVVKTANESEINLWLISEDICNIYIDDIALKELKE